MTEFMSIDEMIERLLAICEELSDLDDIESIKYSLLSIHSRLSAGELHIAVIGQFNRGKSTFINRLTGIDLLPVSVLPLTAIPTEIRYGEEVELQIRFDDETVAEFGGSEEIENALTKFVTEENNPENSAGVQSVRLTAPSSLLSHGTTIIDTPGFGSTHIHNTKATVSLLKECDAVLFVLSADLPITQMELNFIKQITPHVSRLFFVYNKTDLLSETELETTSNFIKKTIETQIGLPTEGRFFPVSAKNAKEDRETSGLAVIEREVLDFLQREKYFSLAEAIRTKLVATRELLIHAIDHELNSLEINLKSVRESIQKIDSTVSELAEKLANVAKNCEVSGFTDLTITEMVLTVSDRIKLKISELSKVNRVATSKLNCQLERYLFDSLNHLVMEQLIHVREHASNEYSVKTIAIPTVHLTELMDGIGFLRLPSIFGSSESNKEFVRSELSRFVKVVSPLLFERISLLIRRFETEASTSVVVSLSSEVEQLRAQKQVLESKLQLIEQNQQERTSLLCVTRTEIAALKM